MKHSEKFKERIQKYLDGLAVIDTLFAESLKNPKKNLDVCCTYIVNQAQKSGRAGFADEEVYDMAVHYYDEAEIEVGKPVNYKVIVNEKIELTEEQIKAAKDQAFQKVVEEEKNKIQRKPVSKKPAPATVGQTSLF